MLAPSLEGMVSLKPDLVVATIAGNRQETFEQLGRLKIPVYVVNPVTVADVLDLIARLGRLADRGDADAQWQLGVRYHNGEEVAHDDTQAVMWFFRAAEQGHALAQATLGAYYWAGRGVPQDLSKAYFWSTLALAQGDENSRSRLEGLASQMTKSQVSSARQQAELWLRAHNEHVKFQNTKSR